MSEPLLQELLQLLQRCRPLLLQNCNKPKDFPRAISAPFFGVVASDFSELLQPIAGFVAGFFRTLQGDRAERCPPKES
jgi:hypothetical protein